MLADGSYEELPQREYAEEEGLPRQDKYAIGLPCPDTRMHKGIDFLDFIDPKGIRFSDVADGKMTLDEFMTASISLEVSQIQAAQTPLVWEISRNMVCQT